MTMTDPIADMLTRIRNASKARNEFVDIPKSSVKLNLIRLLKSEGFVEDFKIVDAVPQGFLRVFMKYAAGGEPVIRGLKRVSTPGSRKYVGKKKIPRPLGGLGIAIVTTPRGIMTDTQARKEGVGGELLCYAW
ncbi:MAG: 30S ribosomal protein S8 [Chlamydiota bacterium]